jgi:hypothetical protein
MTFDYCSLQSVRVVRVEGSTIVASLQRRIRFAVEDFPAIRTLGASMQVGDERFDSEEIHCVYESDDYPLRRRTGLTAVSCALEPR